MTKDNQELFKSFLGVFNSEHYEIAIKNIQEGIKFSQRRKEEWREVSNVISLRGLPHGEPLGLVNHTANQVLDENSDEEAWRWLELMVTNVEQLNDKIISY